MRTSLLREPSGRADARRALLHLGCRKRRRSRIGSMRGIEQIPWIYDAMCAVAEWQGMRRWREWVARGARGRTLDLGCGTGRSLPLFPQGATAIGIDPSADALRRARRRAPEVPLVR